MILIIGCVSSLFLISIFVLNYVIKEQLTENSLAANQRYASKIAFSTDKYFESMLSELRYSAQIVGQDFSNQQVLKAEVTRLKGQSQKFIHAQFIVNATEFPNMNLIHFGVRLNHFYSCDHSGIN